MGGGSISRGHRSTQTPRLFHKHTHTEGHTQAHTHTQTHTQALSLTHTHGLLLTHGLSQTHTHTHPHTGPTALKDLSNDHCAHLPHDLRGQSHALSVQGRTHPSTHSCCGLYHSPAWRLMSTEPMDRQATWGLGPAARPPQHSPVHTQTTTL